MRHVLNVTITFDSEERMIYLLKLILNEVQEDGNKGSIQSGENRATYSITPAPETRKKKKA